MGLVKITGAVFVAVLLCLSSYWIWRVVEARAVTPSLIAGILADADPSLLNLPRTRIDSLIALEDPTFWENDGIDLRTPGQGLTTLTQALGKRIYFDPFRPGFRKFELMFISKYALSRLVSKDDILQGFMNVAYMGRDADGPIIGLGEGARRWYGRDVSQISDDEYLGLIAMLVAPEHYDPVRHKDANAQRVGRIKNWRAGRCAPDGLRDVLLEGCSNQ